MEALPQLVDQLRSLTGSTTGKKTIVSEYNMVRSKMAVLRRDLGLTTATGALKDNIKKNRYKDILPYDQSRVVLSLQTSDGESDYINASFVQGATANRVYIATQGPLSSTLVDFWRMIWEYDVKVVVMACREVELGKRKCECYWAPDNQSSSFGPFTVYNGKLCPNEEVVVRSLSVSFQQESRSLLQYQYTAWPDHDIPYEAAGILDMMEMARHKQGDHPGPLLIHCSAGSGRTGVICALDYIHDSLVTKQIREDFSIMKIVLELRRQRPAAVQTKEQYQFVFSAVVFMFERALQSSANHLYHNLNQLKQPVYDDVESLKRPEHTTTTTTGKKTATKRSSRVSVMSDTYAVVNKPKQPHPSSTNPAHSPSPSPRATPRSHHYDNDLPGATAAPLYSTVKPRAKPIGLPHPPTPIYDMAGPTSPRQGEGSLSLGNNAGYELVPAELHSLTEDDYEYISNPITEMTSPCSPGNMGFNCRIKKPRGPREPPAEWSKLER